MATKFKSHCATVRPKNGVDNLIQARFLKYCKKQDYALAVMEMDGAKRHIHMQFWFNEPRELSVTQRAMENNQKAVDPNWDDAAKKVCRNGVTHAYNDDFMNNYLSVDKDGHEIILKRIPKNTEFYYPSQEYQDKAKTIALAADKRFCKLSMEFLEWNEKQGNAEVSLLYVAEYLSWRMFTARNMYVLTSRKAKQELAENLYWYSLGGCTSTAIWSFIDDGNKKTSPLYEHASICKDCSAPTNPNEIFTGFALPYGKPFTINCAACFEKATKSK